MTCPRGGPGGSPARRSDCPMQAAGFVDSQVAPFAHRIGPAEVDRLVADAVGRFMPAEAEEQRRRAADGRYFAIEHTQVSFTGTSRVHGELDLADALDLETRIAHEAAVLAACGSQEPLDVRRSQAIGQIARQQTSLDLTHSTDDDPTRCRPPVPARQTIVHVHLSPEGPFARVEASGRRIVTVDQVREWLHTPLTQVDHQAGDRPGRPPPRDPVRSPRPARGPDRRTRPHLRLPLVHPTSDPLRRRPRHPLLRRRTHRLGQPRTAVPTAPPTQDPLALELHRPRTRQSYLWSSPHGYQYLRDHRGTTDVSRDRPPDT